MSVRLTGTGVALVTPFDAAGAVDFAALEKLVNHVINGGVQYLVVLGTTGETATLNKEEKQQIFEAISRYNAGRVKLVAGIGGNNTAETLHLMKSFNVSGYSAFLSVSPYYNKPNQEGLFLHYQALSTGSPLPIIIYNVPGRTGMNMTAATQLRITNLPNIIATKEASGNLDQCMDIIQGAPAHFDVISGDDGYTLPFISLGMCGVISVIANAYPREFSEMVNACLAGDFNKARELHYPLLPAIKAIFADGSPGGIKVILEKMGICGPALRLPLAPPAEAVKAQLLNSML